MAAKKHILFYKFLKILIGPLFIKIFIKDIKNIKSKYPSAFIIASNHISYLDPPIIGSVFSEKLDKKVHFLGKEALFRSSVPRFFHKSVETINLNYSKDKGESALKIAAKYLKKGKIVGIFPEGRVTTNGGV